MKKKLFGIIASPRKHGNCELMLKDLFLSLGDEWELELVRLPELDIQPCKACYSCLFGEMRCVLKDDVEQVLEALAGADAYAVAAPVYFLGANASLKRLLDRGLSFYARLDDLWGKPAVGLTVAGIPGMEGYAKLSVDSFIKLTFGDLKASTVVYGAMPGEVFTDGDGKALAAHLARALLGDAEEKNSSSFCPQCGGDTFRLLPEGGLRCMVCSSAGSYSWDAGSGLQIRTSAGDHPMFLTIEHARYHLQWLQGMKELFLTRRKEFKSATEKYKQVDVRWVKSKSDSQS